MDQIKIGKFIAESRKGNKVHFFEKKFFQLTYKNPITSFRKTIIFLKNISSYAILLV